MQIKIAEQYQGQRLDKFLVSQFPELSRSAIQKAIQQKKVLINNKKNIAKHYFLNTNDIIDINFKTDDLKPKKINLKSNKNIKLNIIFEDDNYLVLNKPANLVVHPGNTHPEQDTLINGVIAKYPEITKVGEEPMRPGIVHRLDKEVSGLIVIAKTQTAFLDLKQQFKNRTVYKEYVALVHGKLSKKHDIIKFNITRSKTNGYKMAARPDKSGQEAITEYDVIKEYNNYSLLKIIIHTGRTHQIRVHLNAIGHPILGDQVYRPRLLKSSVKLDRIFLHAKALKFNDLDNNKLEFEQKLPTELEGFLEKIT